MEESLLSALLHNPDEIPKAFSIDSEPELMDGDENRELWRGIIDMHNDGLPIDPQALLSHVTQKGYLDKKTAESKLRRILRLKEVADNVEGWVEMLADLKGRRQIVRSCTDAKKMAKDMNTSMQEVRRHLTDRMAESQKIERPELLGDVALSLIERLDKDEFDNLSGTINTGMRELDSILDGLMWDDFIGILSRPGWGKTSLMIQLALGMKVLYPKGIIDIFSIEMSEDRITYRFVSQLAGLPYSTVKKALHKGEDVGQKDESKIREALHTLNKWKDEGSIRIYTGSKTPEDVCQMMRANAMKDGSGDGSEERYLGAFIDNFHRFHDIPTLEQKESAIKAIKDVTIDINSLAFLLLQLNRTCEVDNVPPKISHAKSVGQIEQDLDRGIIIDRPDERAKHLSEGRLEELGINLGEAIIDVAKNRESKPDSFKKFFHGPTMQFLDRKPFGDDAPPAAGRDPIGFADSEEVEEATEEDVEEFFAD